ncbi:SDR family NAD(P)-dependent oxidoreductase [Streptomyces sp. YGL11-2]|uniref:SDR family NAD(P)-dependent oxidoreductase n=1 Tax=Streptomyces sp. YGL11-2 TaxID=3414028 RepID=UPI003CF13523
MSRVVLVTGGSRGIGLAIAEHQLSLGNKVAITHLTTEAPKLPGLLPIRCDVTRTDEVDRAFTRVEQELGEVDVLVANAGVIANNFLEEMTDEQWDRVIDVNLTGTMKVARRACRSMKERRAGRIIVMSSALALAGGATQTNYAASKAGQLGFARGLAEEVAEYGVTVNVICPGPTDTPMYRSLPEEFQRQLVARTRTKRLIQTAEVAAVVNFLTSPDAKSITGHIMEVDGGGSWGH